MLNLIGNTPIIKLSSISDKKRHINIYGKLEGLSLSGSIKERTAISLISWAEENKNLKPGDLVVEASSGNLGLALSMICARKGYRFICIVDPKMPEQNKHIMQAHGSRVIVSKEKDANGSYQQPRIKLAKEIASQQNGIYLDQYNNPCVVEYHEKVTGKEIDLQFKRNIDLLVGSVSTGSHLCGISKHLKKIDENLKVLAVEPVGSVIFGGCQKPFLQNGTGLSFTPGNYFPEQIDYTYKVSDKDAFNMARTIARKEGLLIGGSSGGSLYAARRFSSELNDNSNILVILPDMGHKYANTIYNDEWYLNAVC